MDKSNNVNELQLDKYLSKCDVKPRRFHLITTINMVENEGDSILIEDEDNTMISEWQYVIAVGDGVDDYTPGDKILIDMSKMVIKTPNPNNKMEMVEAFNFKPVEIDDKYFNIISENVILAKKYEYENIDL